MVVEEAHTPAATDPQETPVVSGATSIPPASIAGFVRSCLAYLAGHWPPAFALFVALVATTAFFALQPLIFRALVDGVLLSGDSRRLGPLVAALIFAVLLLLAGEVASSYLAARMGAAVMNDLRLQVFNHLQHLSLDFYGRARVGQLMASYTADLSALEDALVRTNLVALSRALVLVTCAVVLLVLNWPLALAILALMLGLALSPRVLRPLADRASHGLQQDAAQLASAVHETIGAQPVIQAYGLDDRGVAGLHRQAARLARNTVRVGLLSGLQAATLGAGGTVLRSLAVAIGAVLVLRASLSLGTLFAFAELLWFVSESLRDWPALARPVRRAAEGNQRIQALLKERPLVSDAEFAEPLPPFSKEIRFRGVTSSYSGVGLDLKGVSFVIPRGWSVAFVGPSGCGKSTVLKLLMRLFEPSAGSITVDDWDLRQVTQESLRAQMGAVFQESFLFASTIRENIRVGRPEASDTEVEAAAQAAELHDFVLSLPAGYDTLVGPGDGELTTGQRQRIAIARALVRDPTILVLDEATSGLDGAAEAAINATLQRAAEGRTVVAATHRLSTVVGADHIFVLEGGELVEQGTHQELLARDGAYHRLWQKQSGMVVDEDGTRAAVEVARLRMIPILNSLDDDLLAEVADRFVTEGLVEYRTVIHQGDPGDKFYIIVRGTVEVLKESTNDTPKRLAVLQDGDHFGEIALLKNVPRTATVRTLAPTVFLTLQRGQFLELLEKAPHLRQTLEEVNLGRIVSGTAPS